MEISPIAGIRIPLAPKSLSSDSELAPVIDVDSAAPIGDDSYSSSDRKGASAAEPDDEEEKADAANDDSANESQVNRSDGKINFFA
jgi:hypothetical protein